MRLVVYPAVVAMAFGTVAARGGWFRATGTAAGHGAADPVVVLGGETAEGQRISISVANGSVIRALQTSLVGACSNGGTDQIRWSPDSPRIPFQRTVAGIVVKEFKQQALSDGVVARRWASTVAHVGGGSVSGDAQYHATYRWPNDRRVTCDSGPIHWTAGRTLSTPAGSITGSTYPFGAWAGYAWSGRVRSVGAAWRVPAIRAGSPAGFGATWIGAQAPARLPDLRFSDRIAARAAERWKESAVKIPFIQVGVTEARDWSRTGGVKNEYSAFWTDSVHRFKPISLFAVTPGDEIAARLTLEHKRWRVAISDLTSGARKELDTSDEGLASFNDAEWLQENPESPPFGTDEYLYPLLSQVRMRGLVVNGAPPRQASVSSAWMSEDGSYLAPSELVGDSFTLHQAALSPAGRRYLTVASRLDAAIRKYAAAARGAGATTARKMLTGALSETVHALGEATWPTRVQELINRLSAQTRALMSLAPSQTDKALPVGSAWINESRQAGRTGRGIRTALDLPQLTLG